MLKQPADCAPGQRRHPCENRSDYETEGPEICRRDDRDEPIRGRKPSREKKRHSPGDPASDQRWKQSEDEYDDRAIKEEPPDCRRVRRGAAIRSHGLQVPAIKDVVNSDSTDRPCEERSDC